MDNGQWRRLISFSLWTNGQWPMSMVNGQRKTKDALSTVSAIAGVSCLSLSIVNCPLSIVHCSGWGLIWSGLFLSSGKMEKDFHVFGRNKR